MTNIRQDRRNLIPKPVSQACLAGASASSLAIVFGVPIEYAPRIALAGAGFSLWLSWNDSRLDTRSKKRNRGRAIPFSTAQGVKSVYPDDMEFSVSHGSYIKRDTWSDTFSRLIFGRKETQGVSRPIEPAERPEMLDEFYFISQGVQLRKSHVNLFLKSAWRNRQNGKGLSARRWVRNFNERPAWYKELSPTWYYAMMRLLYDAEVFTGCQIVLRLDNQQSFLAVEPYQLIRILKWYEYGKAR